MIGVIWDNRFLDISFSHPMIRDISKQRMKKFWELIREEPEIVFIKPELGDENDLKLVHTDEYIRKLKEASDDKYIGFLDSGDTVHYPGMFKDILLILGSSDAAIRFSKFYDKIYIPLGGFHHALPNSAMGFCPINDVAIAVKKLKMKGIKRIAIVDSDAHHPNGLQYIFYNDKIVKINIFTYDGKFFPRHWKIRRKGRGRRLWIQL